MAKMRIMDVRVTFPQFHEAKAVNGQGDPKFSGSFLLTKDHPQLGAIQEAVIAAATEKWGPKAGEILKQLKAADKLPLHDGDAKANYDGYAGMYYMNASNKIRPLVIGGGPDGRAPLTATDGKPYSGCYVNVVVEFWAQDNQYGKRVNASLLGVQFLRDGERLAGGSVASEDDFEAIPQDGKAKAEASGDGAGSLFG